MSGEQAGRRTDVHLAVDTRVGDFRIRALIGEGAMGEVYLAQDTTLGRRVALKLIKRSVMDDDGLDRFFEEARATASFNHPNIVTLHAVGEHDGRPFLALEYVDGESLRTRLAAGPLSVHEALRYGHAIAEAIAEAHRRGLVHADLKPENVVIPRDGRVRVVDFGLAKLVGGTPNSASGTPAYMAPERWRGAPPTGAIDIWALGVLLHELITGRRPIGDRELAQLAFAREPVPLPELPAAPWATLVRACLAFDPAARPAADAVVRQLAAILDPRAAVGDDHARSPFPGLAAFTRDNAADYFGRRTELDAIVELLRTRPLIPIVGPSGIGKSSFVRAALVPRLEETAGWHVIALRPGATPLASLAAALAGPARPAAELADALRRAPDTLSLLLDELARAHRARILVFVDQFEETFTLGSADAVAFCECLGRAALADEPWRIVLTLRDDFFGRLTASAAIRPHLGAVMPLPALSSVALRAAILGPLANAGYEPDSPDLAQRIVDDVKDQPACLPLLQFACRSLWDRRDVAARHILTREYEAIGGATGALATHAQQFLAELAPEQVRIARGILLALVNPDGTRRPRLRADLVFAGGGEADAVIERLLERRLIVVTRDTEHDVAMLEVAHEALATAWPQLARWLDETYEQRTLVSELEQAALLWQRRGKRDDETWGGAALGEAVRKVDEWQITLPSVSRAFLDACVDRDHRARRRRRWITGTTISALAVIAVFAIVAAIAFSRKEREAVAAKTLLDRSVAQMQLAAADMGTFELELAPFDWDEAHQAPVPPRTKPPLAWKLYAADRTRPSEPGDEYAEAHEIRRGTPVWRGDLLVESVQARSSKAFLEIERGPCAPSRLVLERLPGFSERAQPRTIRIRVPTCAATAAGMVEIPAGPFIFNAQAPDGTRYDIASPSARFAIDRTEVTRAAFAMYQAMEPLTGDGSIDTSYLDVDVAADDRLPTVGITYETARNYCRYLGKELPTIKQWQKAFRGGIEIAGQRNPAPARLTPWITAATKRPANIDGDIAAVGTSPDDTSPYGIVDHAGNVSEWTADMTVDHSVRGLRTVLGASWATPADLGHEQITWRNARADRYLDFELGVRCVVDDEPRAAR